MRGPDLRLALADVPAVNISGDGLKKIVQELLDNAFKFSSPGQLVTVSATADAEYFWLSVTNEGRGMMADQIADVGAYMQFQRRLYEQQGSGLGLSLVRGLVTVYAGDMKIESVPDHETTVTVVLPLFHARA